MFSSLFCPKRPVLGETVQRCGLTFEVSRASGQVMVQLIYPDGSRGTCAVRFTDDPASDAPVWAAVGDILKDRRP